MVLSGEINSEIVSLLNHYGAKAIGISGKDAKSITAEAINMQELGYAGDITDIKAEVIQNLIDEKFIP
ncbi:MAG: acetylglutamate kinase, partial [Campylobacterota bacterium]|nr:acetylglutamate kinase [Campylobacterota bacterium]